MPITTVIAPIKDLGKILYILSTEVRLNIKPNKQ